MSKMTKGRNVSVDFFRYICSILVIIIHTNPFTEINSEVGYIFCQVLPRIAVPFFFAVSGYYYTRKLEDKKKALIPYVKRILITYGIWSCVYFILNFIEWGHTSVKDFIYACLYGFFVEGSFYHFWFFPALIFSVCFVTLLFKLKCAKLIVPISLVLYIVGCLGCSYYSLGTEIPLVKELILSEHFLVIRRVLLMGFPFFVSGYLVRTLKERVSAKKLPIFSVLSAIIWIVEICLVVKFELQTNIVITFGLYLLVVCVLLIILKDPFSKLHTFSRFFGVTANFTYYSHPLFIVGLNAVAGVMNIQIPQTVLFFITVILTSATGYVIYKLNNKYLNFLVK